MKVKREGQVIDADRAQLDALKKGGWEPLSTEETIHFEQHGELPDEKEAEEPDPPARGRGSRRSA